MCGGLLVYSGRLGGLYDSHVTIQSALGGGEGGRALAE